jgi:hypothetical protein
MILFDAALASGGNKVRQPSVGLDGFPMPQHRVMRIEQEVMLNALRPANRKRTL